MVEALSVTSYLPSSSSEINLTVGTPVASIVSCTFPSSPQKAGTSLKVSFTIINNGVYGTIYFRLRDNRTLEEFGTSTAVLAPGEQRSWDVYITMPSRDITLQLSAGHIVDSSYYMDDYRQQDILLLIEVPTALTLSLNKTTASPGETLTATGMLTRTDTGSGLGGQTVYLLVDGSTVKNTTTASDGSYSMSFSAPTSTGAHKVKAEFRGATASAILSVEYIINYAIPISILVLGVALSTYIPKIKSR